MPPPSPDLLAATPRSQLRQFALQTSAALLVMSLAWPYYGLREQPLPWSATAFAIGTTALLIATLTRQTWWWRLIHAAFTPLAWAVAQLAIDPAWFLLAFIGLLLIYRGALGGQIPLYLSNRPTAATLATLTAECGQLRFLDLGAGIGSVIKPLAEARPDAQFDGVENAPATWLAGRLRIAGQANCRIFLGDIWKTGLGDYDVVYAFLSPVPMAALWEKVRKEMRPGSLFISNSFPVPDIAPSSIAEVDDARQTMLYCYQR